MKQILKDITQVQLKERTAFKVGDGVKVHTKVREGDKERIQLFKGIVIARRGSGISESFTVRRIASGVGVERVFPLNSPSIEKIEVERESVVMKSRLYYLRGRVGKEATKVKEKNLLELMGATQAPKTEAAPAAEAPKAEKAEKPAKAEKAPKAEKKAKKE